jgi:pSer/pThr/pTyr-binding forkhead associated (FHA) protein
LAGRRIIYLGRHQDSQVVLKDKAADTRQAVIYWEDGRYKINNLSARSQTRVNGRPITKQNLGDGNSITMGRTVLIFRDRGEPQRKRPPAHRRPAAGRAPL